jgi:hypothetical protein
MAISDRAEMHGFFAARWGGVAIVHSIPGARLQNDRHWEWGFLAPVHGNGRKSFAFLRVTMI